MFFTSLYSQLDGLSCLALISTATFVSTCALWFRNRRELAEMRQSLDLPKPRSVYRFQAYLCNHEEETRFKKWRFHNGVTELFPYVMKPEIDDGVQFFKVLVTDEQIEL